MNLLSWAFIVLPLAFCGSQSPIVLRRRTIGTAAENFSGFFGEQLFSEKWPMTKTK
jgi:hypothetical protein